MYMSKVSLYDETPGRPMEEDVTSVVYNLIRDHAVTYNTDTVPLAALQGQFSAKSLSADQVEEALREYESLNIWIVGKRDRHVRFTAMP
mmetsp:Transcript_48322/g.104774  ORF Transcript_48322/g.104774 Transcript_48322/m.104774 type:complete len:89 (-) Transcript_48322:49-315(-)